jgi:multidrug resistance efflux pump
MKELGDGPDDLELRQAQITLRQRQTTLAKAQKELANYSLKAPFDGVVASV